MKCEAAPHFWLMSCARELLWTERLGIDLESPKVITNYDLSWLVTMTEVDKMVSRREIRKLAGEGMGE